MEDERYSTILGTDYLDDLEAKPIEEIRAMRAECNELESVCSYVRRIAQARLDIVGAEIRRRAEGGDPSTVADMVARLPEILADRVRAPGLGRLPQVMAPGGMEGHLAELDAVASSDTLAGLPQLSPERLRTLADELVSHEQNVSSRRRQLHDRIDQLQAELTRRYKSGEASVESLLAK